MSNHYKHPHSKDLDTKDPHKELYIRRPIYIDTPTCKGNTLKVTNNKDIYKGKEETKIEYDYLSLRNILREEMDKPVTLKQAEIMGNALTDLYKALYFEEI